MTTITFLYNIFLLILFSTALTCIFALYIKSKRKTYLYTALLLLLFISDNTVIYMTEFLQNFSQQYDNGFMDVPAFKTIIVLGTAYLYNTINNEVLQIKKRSIDYFVLLAFAIYLLFIPMFPDSALNVWLYYLPAQLYLGYLALSSLIKVKKEPVLYSDAFYHNYKILLKLSLLFSVLILIEDTIVIFNFDSYSSLLVKINNRSLSEDLLSIIYANVIIIHSFKYLSSSNVSTKKPAIDGPLHSNIFEEVNPIDYKSSMRASTMTDCEKKNIEDNCQDPQDTFCGKYQFTNREKDVFYKILEAKSNEEISQELFISVGTVKTHTHNIYQKAGVNKRTQLVQIYHQEDK
ncbi:regulatory protein, luxR family [Carnobacterium iners]|uniref:Regulatory protein, luxR family n=1 Tax=Carnobacterium iners TaxID=1073423 RepID=A0A1X7MUK8_9LACT|nr:LuxR C-terminal-related transcriptional regulator [Carnobacterium iners]SEK58328.1 regulatory protein, luxR family [Carnobacterium iners]SMH28031.1 regulatory protein, luxR family [Carnobacterium iners]